MTSGPLNRPIEIDIRSTITQTINQTQIEHINKKKTATAVPQKLYGSINLS